jgi:hypothetical protein
VSRPNPGAVIALVALAAAVATAGAVVNLRLLEPHRPDEAPMVLGATIERTSTTTGPAPSVDDGQSATSQPPPFEPAPTTTTPNSTTSTWRRSYLVGEAGEVTIVLRGAVLDVESVTPSAGWAYEVGGDHDDEVELTFRRDGHEGESTFHASLHDGELRVEIEPAEGESPDD